MYKHSTTHRTLSRRLAALLAALALLAAMALPVYAEVLEDATGTAQAEIGDTISDGTVTTENNLTTPEVEEKTEDENSESNGDSLPGREQDQNEAEMDESETQDGATDIIEFPAQDDTDAEDQTKDETAEVSNGIATQAAAEDFTVYFAAPAAWGTPKQVTFIGKKGSDGTGDQAGNLEKAMSLTDYVTSDGRLVYKVELHYQEPSDNSNVDIIKDIECPFNGYVWMKVKGDQQEVSLSDTWTYKDNFKGRCYIDGVWRDISELKQSTPHQRLAGKTMYFKNATDAALENVQVVFYEKTNDQYVEVGRQQLNTVGKNDVASFTIPAAACAYVQILVNGQKVGAEYYNFYNDDTTLAENAKFTYDSATNCCFTYSGENQATWGAHSGGRIYFDATYSAYEYTGDSVSQITQKKGMPTADTSSDHSVHCRFYDASGNATSETRTMTQIKDASASSRSLWYIDIPEGKTYTNVRFSAWSTIEGTGKAKCADLTDVLTIPYNLTNPCFFADNGDDVTYNSSDANRDGYWGEMDSVRNAGSGKTGKAPVVDIAKDTFTQKSDTKYVNSTLYDYYTDWELNGNNRDGYKHDFNETDNDKAKKFSTNRNWAPFRQFDFAVSDYYATAGEFNTANAVLFPIYTGHFQPGEYGWESFADLKRNDKIGLDLFGFTNGRAFMAANNSALCANTDDNRKDYYDYTFQGIVADQEVNGLPIMRGTEKGTKLVEPHFNADFLKGNNSQKAKLGDVYENVSFPFTQADVFGENVKYWAFDAADTTLYLRQDSSESDKSYFLQKSDNRKASENRVSNSDVKKENNNTTYGFFPFNETIPNDAQASNYNYGFGAKLQFNFTLTENGKVKSNDGSQEVPIKFFFSGDDDVWVFIDGKLVLDVGGAHGKASGLLEFGTKGDKNTVTPYVSKVKVGGTANRNSGNLGNSNDWDNKVKKTITYQGSNNKNEKIDFYYAGDPIEYEKGGTHTLTMYYMERGMWESNMAIAFNFPDSNELQVQKIVDDRNVNELFTGCFDNQRFFNFTIRNQATHYGTKDAKGDTVTTINLLQPGKSTPVQNFTTTATHAEPDTGGKNRFTIVNSPPADLKVTDGTPLLNWYTQFEDLTPSPGSNKEKRYGILTLDEPINITGMSYLSFDVYVDSDEGDAALSNMYLQLRDSSDKKKGCLGQTFIGGKDLYGQVEMHNNRWITVKLSLDDVKADEGFDGKRVKELRFGCNYPRSIYLRNIVFSSKAVPQTVTGFTTKQEDIADYGSAKKGELMPAVNAQYTSDAEKGTMVVDKNGGFVLKNKEMVTFKDQFRRGSYLSINEQVDKNLFDTHWTIYEDGMPVKSTKAGQKLTLENNISLSLENKTGTAPDDGRIEVKNAESDAAQTAPNYNAYDGIKPSKKDENNNTIVFRSYANPDATDAEGETQLKVVFVNTVKTGSLTIKKEQDGKGESLTGKTYTFRVRFTNVGGHALEDEAIVKTYPVTVDEPCVINNIPVGTRFTIEEVTPTEDGSKLTHASVTGGGSGTMVLSNNTVRGSIVEGVADGENQAVATFTNTKQELLDITGTKVWEDANGTPVTSNLPDIYVQLQRRHKDDSEWEAVEYRANEPYQKITDSYDGMTFSFLGLPAKDYSKDNKPDFEYRVVEGYLDKEGAFHAVEDKGPITIDEKVYCVTYNPVTVSKPDDSSNNAEQTVTITNTQQDPKFTLDITKADAEDGKTLLKDVEFTLEKLDENNNVVKDSAKYGITNNQGKLMIKDADGNPTDAPAFTGLEAGKYRLTETKAAENYNLLSAPIEVEFTKTGQCLLNGVKVNVSTADQHTDFTKDGNDRYTLALTVLNRKTPALPHTGADAPSLWLLIGLPLAVAGLLILVFRYNKKGGRTR